MNLSALEWTTIAVSLFAALLQLWIFGVLVKRRMRSDFPVFLVYNAYAAIAAFVLTACFLAASMSSSGQYYFWVWAGLNSLLMVLQFGLMYELFVNAIKPYTGLIDLGKMLFGWAAVFLLLAAVLTATATGGPVLAKCLAAAGMVEKVLRLMQCGMLLLFFLFERRLALSWRSYPVSLGMGLGILAALGLSFPYLREHFPAWTPALGIVDNVSYLGVVTYWAICFARPEPARKNVLDSPSKLIFQRWNEALIAAPLVAADKNSVLASVDSFLPGIEKTVDRVLARKIH